MSSTEIRTLCAQDPTRLDQESIYPFCLLLYITEALLLMKIKVSNNESFAFGRRVSCDRPQPNEDERDGKRMMTFPSKE